MSLSLNVKYGSEYFTIYINIDPYLKHVEKIKLHWFFGFDSWGNSIVLIFFFCSL